MGRRTPSDHGGGELRAAGRHRGGAGGGQLGEEAKGTPAGCCCPRSQHVLAVGVTSAAVLARPLLSPQARNPHVSARGFRVFFHWPPPSECSQSTSQAAG